MGFLKETLEHCVWKGISTNDNNIPYYTRTSSFSFGSLAPIGWAKIDFTENHSFVLPEVRFFLKPWIPFVGFSDSFTVLKV